MSDEQLADENLASADVRNLPEATPASEQALLDKPGEPPTNGAPDAAKITMNDIIAGIQKRIESGTVVLYASLGGQTYIRTTEPGLVEIDAPCPSARAAEWVMAAAFQWFEVVLKKGDAQTVCMILAGGAVPILPGEKSDLELLQRIERSPVISTVVEFMASRTENRYSGLAEELWKDLINFIDKRGLYWGGGKAFPGGASILTRRLNADAEILRRCGIKYENSRGSEGAKVVLSRLPEDTDGTSTMPSSMPSGSNLEPDSALTSDMTRSQAVLAFQERRKGRPQLDGSAYFPQPPRRQLLVSYRELMRPDDLMRQVPPKWSGVVGNKRLVRYLRNVARKIRTDYAETGTLSSDALLPIFVSGPSRTGKSAVIKLFLRTLVCQELDDELNPCAGACVACRERPEVFGMSGLYTVCATAKDQLPIHMSMINCADVESRQALKDSIQQGLNIVDGLVVLFLDEAHRLAKGHFHSSLLTAVDDMKVLWIVATAVPGELEEMFPNRFHSLSTERPTTDDMADWLSIKCDERNIAYEDGALFRLIEKCDRVPGMALHALAVAALDPEGLTLDFVENEWNAKPT